MTVAEFREQTLRQIAEAARRVAASQRWRVEDLSCPAFIAAIRALPDTSQLARLAPEMRAPIETALRTCDDYTPLAPAGGA